MTGRPVSLEKATHRKRRDAKQPAYGESHGGGVTERRSYRKEKRKCSSSSRIPCSKLGISGLKVIWEMSVDTKMRHRLGAVLRTGQLRNILIVSVCTVIVFLMADRFFVYPLFYGFMIENPEVDAIRTVEHLAIDRTSIEFHSMLL